MTTSTATKPYTTLMLSKGNLDVLLSALTTRTVCR